MSSTFNLSGAIKVGNLASAPPAVNGSIYYNTTDNKLYICRNGTFRVLVDDDSILSLLEADEIGFDPTGLDIVTATDVQGAIAQLDAALDAVSGSFASTALDNLASVAVNADLNPSANNSRDIGTGSLNWKDIHARSLQSNDIFDLIAQDNITISSLADLALIATDSATLSASSGSVVLECDSDIILKSVTTKAVVPDTADDIDLGKTSKPFQNIYTSSSFILHNSIEGARASLSYSGVDLVRLKSETNLEIEGEESTTINSNLGTLIRTKNDGNLGNSATIGIQTGTSGDDNSGQVYIRTGDAFNGVSGSIEIRPGGGSSLANTGHIDLRSKFVNIEDTENQTAAQLRLVTNDGNPQYIALKAPNDLAANRTYTLPSAAPTNGYFLQTDGSGNLAWASAAGSTEFSDSAFRIQDNGDATKQLAFEVSGIATATTRTITMPDANIDLADIATALGLANDLVTLSGVAANAEDLGTFTGSIISDNETIKGALQDLETFIEALPSPMVYRGTWNANTNSPSLADGTGDQGDVYRVTVAGTQDLGSGNISFEVGDSIVYNGATWEKWDMTDAVASVNGLTGAVVLDLDDLDDVNAPSPSNGQVLTWDNVASEWVAATPAAGYTDEEAQDAVGNILDNGTTGDIEFDYDDATPEISALVKENVTLRGIVSRAIDHAGGNAIQEQYFDSIALSSAQTNTVIASLSFDHSEFEGVEITYRLKEASTNAVRIGTIRIATNGTDVSINDVNVETAAIGISFSAVVNGSDVDVRYSSGANGGTLRADVKRFRA
jgi:hypothetical protein